MTWLWYNVANDETMIYRGQWMMSCEGQWPGYDIRKSMMIMQSEMFLVVKFRPYTREVIIHKKTF